RDVPDRWISNMNRILAEPPNRAAPNPATGLAELSTCGKPNDFPEANTSREAQHQLAAPSHERREIRRHFAEVFGAIQAREVRQRSIERCCGQKLLDAFRSQLLKADRQFGRFDRLAPLCHLDHLFGLITRLDTDATPRKK